MHRKTAFLLFTLMSFFICSRGVGQELPIATRTLIEWNFDSQTDLQQWKTVHAISDLAIRDGCLTGRVTGDDPFIASPLFEIVTTPLQFIEIRLRTTVSGPGEIYWASTTEPPYEGFRPDKVEVVQYAGGEFRTYRFFPFWQGEKRIIRLRFDPPGDAEFALDYIKVKELNVPADDKSWFDFTSGSPLWFGANSVQPSRSTGGMRIVTEEQALFVAPCAGFKADERPWLSFRIRCRGSEYAAVRWATDTLPGVQSFVFDLTADDRWHTYNIPTAEIPEWQGKINFLALEIYPMAKFSGEIAFAGATDCRKGPAELSIRNFGLTKAIARVGQVANVRADVTNVGGQPTSDLRVILELGPEMKLVGGFKDTMVHRLEPGSTLVLYWAVMSSSAAYSKAKLSIRGGSNVVACKETKLRWYPAVRTYAAKYVPKPKPVRGDYEVGVYYYPGWWDFCRWAVLDQFPERTPVLGYYREGEPDVADWHIKWMVEHGITFIIFDWYWSAGGRSLEHALHNGYMNARYRDLIKFCLLWANHNPEGSSSAEDMENVTKFWLDNYFLLPQYFKIDGKPVVVIFSPERLTKDMGVEGVRKAFERSRQMARERGLPGIYFVACAYPQHDLRTLEVEGYDAISGYNYPIAGSKGRLRGPYKDNVAGYNEYWNAIADKTNLRYIPVADPGWDSRPWHGPNARVWTGKTPELFRRMLENAKAFVERRNPDANPKVLFVEAWNEFGEGDFIEPHKQFGFDYLEAIRDVFTNAPKTHDDLTPEDVKLGPYSFPRPEPKTSWQFDDPASPGWSAGQQMTGGHIENGCFVAYSNGADPAMLSQTTEIDASTFRRVEIRMRVDKGKTGQIFFAGRGRPFAEPASKRFDLIVDGEFHVYGLDLGSVPGWRGTVTALRLDPTDTAGAKVELDYIRFIR